MMLGTVNERREISIPVGLLMGRHSLTKDQAFEALRNAARKERRKIEALAAALIAGKDDIERFQ